MRLCGARRGLVRSARALAAAALLALSGALALPAQAQTCTLQTGDVWCGTLTIGTVTTPEGTWYGYVPAASVGSLSPASFMHEETEITVSSITHNVPVLAEPHLLVETSPALPLGYNFVLQAGSQSFSFAGGETVYIFYPPRVDWSMSDGQTVTLRLRDDSNSAPEFSVELAVFTLPENSAADTVVGTVTATDADDDTLTYSLEGTDAGSFDIDSGTGEIKTRSGVTYNYETKFDYELTAKADDGNGGSDTIDVRIALLDDQTEKSAKPAKPTLVSVPGLFTSLAARWTKPGLNGGPDIIGYEVEYRQGAGGSWTDFMHSGAAPTTTITGLTANTEYQVRVRAWNGEALSDWSDASDPVSTGDPPPPPTVTSVVVASAPQSGNTYRWGETIVFTVTFSEPVRVTGRPGLEVGLDNPAGTSGSTVQARFAGLSESQRPTAGTRPAPVSRHVHFAYTVQPFDRDSDGVRIGADALRLASADRIQRDGTDVDADFDHAALGALSGHRVDGRTTVDGEPAAPVAGAGIAFVDGNGDLLETRADGNHRLSVPEGGSARYGMRLKTRPAKSVVLSFHPQAGDADLDVPRNYSSDRSIGPDEWGSRTVWVRVEAAQDADAAKGERVFAHNTASNDPNYHHLVLPDVVVVEDDDEAGPLALSVADAEATEGVDATLDFVVRLDPKSSQEVTVDYRTEDGTATAGADYTETSGTLTFAPGETEKTVSVPIVDDDVEDDGETVTLVLSNASGATIADARAVGTIRNTETTVRTGLTAAFEGMPGEHDGEGAFRFRVAFSENIGISFRSLREDAFAVTGGRVTRGKRVDDRRDLFEMTVEPDGAGEVTMTLPAGRECSVSGAICTKGENRRQLTNTPTATVSGPPAAPLTAAFEGVPAAHDGQTAFTLRMAFSERVGWMNGRRLREDVVAVAGGRATSASRVNRRRDLWQVTVEPDSLAAVTVTLAAGAACRTPAAVCTSDGRALSTTIATTVQGPVAVSVADARAEEGTDATLDFAVSLSRAASGTVAVAYATADGTATAGADYTARKGQLTFAPGETLTTVRVPVLDDAHDEGEETLTLRLSAASGAVLADGTATGTIENSDKLQQAWLARFGRTVATHVTDAVGDRLRGAPGQESHLTVGGYRLPLGQRGATDGKPEAGGAAPGAETDTDSSSLEALVTGLAGVLGLGPGQTGGPGADPWGDRPAVDPRLGQSRTLDLGSAVNLRQVLLGSSFRLALGRDDAGSSRLRLTAWGRVAGTTFDGRDGIDGRDDTLSLNGDVLTGTVGVDGEWDRLLAGLAVAHSRGDGSYTMPVAGAQGRGDLENTLTSIHPYLRYAVNDRLDVWGVLGYGWGDLTLEQGTGTTYETDTTLAMGAFGGRGILLAAPESGGFQLATRTDAMLTRTSSDAVAGMASGDAEAHRLRLVLEGSRGFTWAEGRHLTPTMEVGLRHDWGDAETGFGLELGGRVQYADPALGLTIDATVRGLLAHEDSDYQEWGASGSLRLDPGATGRGLSLTLAPTWGAASSGVDGLWSRQTTAGLAPNTRRALAARLNAEVGYGFAPFGTGLLTPYAGTVLSEGAARAYRVGTRLQLGGPGVTGLTLNLEGTRQEPAGPQPVNQGLRFQLTWGF